MSRRLEERPGTYALLFDVTRGRRVLVGALGELDVAPGRYVYVGSAFGPGGVRARVARHVRGGGARHWHVDHLREVAEIEGAWVSYDDRRLECAWARDLTGRDRVTVPFTGFGSSDCRCAAHLLRLELDPAGIPDELDGAVERAILVGEGFETSVE